MVGRSITKSENPHEVYNLIKKTIRKINVKNIDTVKEKNMVLERKIAKHLLDIEAVALRPK